MKQSFSGIGMYLCIEGANMPTMPDAVIVFQEANYSLQESIKCRRSCNFRFRNVSKLIEIKLDSEEVDGKLKGIMLAIHASCEIWF
jgi:glutamate dehydrogenase (NADP+)